MRNLCLLTVILFCICNNSFAQITGSFRIEEPEVGVFESGYEPYVSISFPESQPMAEIGCPQLPYVTLFNNTISSISFQNRISKVKKSFSYKSLSEKWVPSQMSRGNPFQDIDKKEALCLSCELET